MANVRPARRQQAWLGPPSGPEPKDWIIGKRKGIEYRRPASVEPNVGTRA